MQSSKQSDQRDAKQDGQEGSGKLQGEGDYASNRRYTESAKAFVESGKVDAAARAAKPPSEQVAAALLKAEQEGASHAKGGRSPSDRKNSRQG